MKQLIRDIKCFFTGHKLNVNYCEKCERFFTLKSFMFTLKDIFKR
jgi:hypothetical protein